MQLDHLMWGAPSLAQGMAEDRASVRRATGGRGFASGYGYLQRSARSRRDCYLEIIAPDPAQSSPGGVRGGAWQHSMPAR